MGSNGRKAVEEEFNWEQESAKLLLIYERLLKSEDLSDTRMEAGT